MNKNRMSGILAVKSEKYPLASLAAAGQIIGCELGSSETSVSAGCRTMK